MDNVFYLPRGYSNDFYTSAYILIEWKGGRREDRKIVGLSGYVANEIKKIESDPDFVSWSSIEIY